MAQITIRVTSPRQLPKTVQTLRLLGLPLSPSPTTSPFTISPFTISPFPFTSSPSSHIPKNVGTSSTSIPPLLVPHATTPKKTLALLRQLGTSAPGPFFAASPAGATNAALFIAACLAPRYPKIRRALLRFRSRQTLSVPHHP